MATGFKVSQTGGIGTPTKNSYLLDNAFGGRIVSGLYNSTLGHYIIMNNYGTIGISTDGTTWTYNNNIKLAAQNNVSRSWVWGYNETTDNYLRKLYWDSTSSRYLAIGHSGTFAHSTDGVNWSGDIVNTGAGVIPYYGWASNGSVQVLTSSGYQGYNQTTGNVAVYSGWTLSYPTLGYTPTEVVYANNKFVSVGSAGSVYTTANGYTWTYQSGLINLANRLGNKTIYNLMWDGSNYVALCKGSTSSSLLTAKSSDAITWSSNTQISTINSSFTSYDPVKIAYGGGVYVAINYYGKMATSSDAITWTYNTNSINFASTFNIEYLNSKFIVLQNNGGLYYSANGITWTNATTNLSSTTFGAADVYSIIWDGSKYIIGGGASKLATSTDLATWTYNGALATLWGASYGVYGLAKIGSTIVAVGYQGKVATSTDGGTTWTDRTSNLASTTWGSYNTVKNIIYDSTNNVVVIHGDGGGNIATSPDGINWTVRTSNLTSTTFGANIIKSMTVNGSGKVVVGGARISGSTTYSNLAYTTNSGANFTYVDTTLESQGWNESETCNGILHNGTQFLVYGNAGSIANSADALTWTQQPGLKSGSFGAQPIGCVIWDGSQYIAIGNDGKIANSATGSTWTVQSTDYTGTGTTNTYVGTRIWNYSTTKMVGHNPPLISTSTNLTSWSPNYSLLNVGWGASNVTSSVFNSNQYLIVGEQGRVALSSDGNTWYYQNGVRTTTWGYADTINDVIWTGTQYVIGGTNGKIATSPDGNTWTYRGGLASTTWSTTSVSSLSYKNGIIVASGGSGLIAYSYDGITWTYVGNILNSSGTRTKVNYLKDKFYVFSYADKKYSYSSDGINWSTATTFTMNVNPTNIAWFPYANKYVLTTDNSQTTYYSSDFSTWASTQTAGNLYKATSLFVSDNMLLLVGRDSSSNDLIYYSYDTINWTLLFNDGSRNYLNTICGNNFSYVSLGSNGITLKMDKKGFVDLDDVLVRRDAFSAGNMWTWGSNAWGRLGDNTTSSRSSPGTTAGGGTNWKYVAGGGTHTTAIKTDGTLWVWGFNNYGQLGKGDTTNMSSPVTTAGGGTNWKQSACGYYYSAAIKTDGTLWTWGRNASGQLGDGTTSNRSSPVTTVGGTNWKQVSCGYLHVSTIKNDGTLWAWGSNASGQLGDGTTSNRSSPVTTAGGGTNWKQVSGGGGFTSAIKTDGTLWTWGFNDIGQLGTGNTTSRSSPGTTAGGGTNWKQVSCGNQHTAAIKTDGTLWVWGVNSYGQLGTNNTTNYSSPVTTAGGGTNWKQVDINNSGVYTIAIKTDGTLWTWGVNTFGRLGDNTTTTRSSPVTTAGGGTNWKQVSCGYNFTTAITDLTL